MLMMFTDLMEKDTKWRNQVDFATPYLAVIG